MLTPEASDLAPLIAEIKAKIEQIVEEGFAGPNLEQIIQQAEAEAGRAGYCSTEKSRQNRRDALVGSAASCLLALYLMDREKIPDEQRETARGSSR